MHKGLSKTPAHFGEVRLCSESERM